MRSARILGSAGCSAAFAAGSTALRACATTMAKAIWRPGTSLTAGHGCVRAAGRLASASGTCVACMTLAEVGATRDLIPFPSQVEFIILAVPSQFSLL